MIAAIADCLQLFLFTLQMQQRRRIWLERQRDHYYASMSKWRRKRPRVIISEAHEPQVRRPIHRPSSPNVRPKV